MQCEEVRNQFTDYLADSLPEPVLSRVHQHLIGCNSCREEAQDLKDIWMKLATIHTDRPDSVAMQTHFEVMLEAYRQGMDHAPSPTWWSSVNQWFGKWWPHQPVLQFGLAIAAIVAGVFIGRQYSSVQPPLTPSTPTVEVTQLRDEIHTMRQMVALSLMQQQSASERLKGVSWSNQIEQPGTEMLDALMDTLRHDDSVNVRLAAVDALRRFGDSQIVRKGVLQSLETQDSPFVQVALIDYVVEMQEKDSIDTLRRLVADADAHQNVRTRAEWGLQNLQ